MRIVFAPILTFFLPKFVHYQGNFTERYKVTYLPLSTFRVLDQILAKTDTTLPFYIQVLPCVLFSLISLTGHITWNSTHFCPHFVVYSSIMFKHVICSNAAASPFPQSPGIPNHPNLQNKFFFLGGGGGSMTLI
jgi:hypothetical protein